MQPFQPEQATFLLQTVFLPSLKNEHGITTRTIQAIPLDKGDYRPDGVSKTALELAWHMAITEMRFLDSVAAGAFDLAPRPMPDSIKNSHDLVAWYQENHSPRLQALEQLSDAQLAKVMDFRGIFQMPAVMFLNLVVNHSAHHRGQLSMYLRPCGAKVPAIYGESHDSAEARKAAELKN